MRIAPLYFLILLSASACQRPGDTQPPLIGITYPKSGVLSEKSLKVEGYVLDDNGVASIVGMGKELLDPSKKGQKLVQFAFQLNAVKSGKVDLRVDATDVNGQTQTIRLPLHLDAKPPVITILSKKEVSKEVKPAKTITNDAGEEETIPAETEYILQISGKVVDNTRVDKVVISVDGQLRALSLPKESTVQFFDELPLGKIIIYAVDVAGNRTSNRVR